MSRRFSTSWQELCSSELAGFVSNRCRNFPSAKRRKYIMYTQLHSTLTVECRMLPCLLILTRRALCVTIVLMYTFVMTSRCSMERFDRLQSTLWRQLVARKNNVARGMGTVVWSWKDDHGTVHKMRIHDVLYFPSSPVNILSVTSLASQLNDDEGTGIDTKRSTSRFYWDHGRFQRTIVHPSSNLPELPINEGFSLAGFFSKVFSLKVSQPKQHCHCHATHLILDDEENIPPPPTLNYQMTFSMLARHFSTQKMGILLMHVLRRFL